MNKLRNLLRLRPKIVLSGLVIAATLALGYGVLTQQHAQAAVDCDDNAIIRCGFTDLNDLVTKYNQDPYKDVDEIYAHWGVTNINTFKNNAKRVTVYRNGDIKLDDGTLVGTGAQSLGRQSFGNPNRKPYPIGNKTYYASSTQTSFVPNSLEAYATFNDDHSLQLAILKACGNPVWAVSPAYKCKELIQEKVSEDTYTYVAKPYTKNGATVSKIVYECGDGQIKTITNNFEQKVTCTYTPGEYTARATVYFKVGGKEVKDTRPACTKPVKVVEPQPTFKCTDLIAKEDATNRKKFTFTATASVTNGAVLQNGIFHFDDGTSSQPINAAGNTVTTTHEYEKPGEYTVTVDLTFNVGKDVNNPKCKVTIKIAPKPCEEKPEQPECRPPEKNCETHPEMEECKPEVIPETGPAQIIGTMLGLGTLTGAGMYYRNSRRNLIDSIFKR